MILPFREGLIYKKLRICEVFAKIKSSRKFLNLQYQSSCTGSNIFFSCDHNQYSIEYIIALSKAKRKHQSDSSEDTGQGHSINEDIGQGHTDSDVSDKEFMETLRSEYQSEPMSDSESNSSFSVDAT